MKTKMRMLPVIFVWLFWLPICAAYRFLGVFPIAFKSHFVILESVMKGLISKGHQVDIISPFPQKTPYPNYTDIANLTAPLSFVNNFTYEHMTQIVADNNPAILIGLINGNDICEAHLGNPVIQNLVRNPPKDPPYDAMIIEVFGAHCFAAIAELLNIPLIGLSTTPLLPWHNELIAQPENLAFVSNLFANKESPTNLWQRTYNTLYNLYCKLYFTYLTRPQDELVRKYFGPNLPSIQKMNLALVLINSHIVLNGIQPMTPAAVQIAGIHIRDDESPLPQELKKWMDDSKDGFVYFTFGSMVLIETFPRKILDVFYASLGKIAPVRVLMKVPNPEKLPAGLPENIRTFRWMPQVKVLKHPNIRAFVTHGGLMSTLEAVFLGVPMIGIPLYSDQFKNMETYVTRNIAMKLDIHKISEEDMSAALNAILHDPRYMENIRNLSQRLLDQPLNPVDTANYWIEYVIKYGDDVLRSPAMALAWWQICLIDVAACLLLCAAAIITFAMFIMRFVVKMINEKHHLLLYLKKIGSIEPIRGKF
ncbi:2-hydroxyacylsphingosine 1-beta-galactosyltransferase [Ooceraea biroi]|uniref:UDP-glucuronosyltransferase n=1 Tax=Ooceraea biroi TaxID=2015173 RepID=A0A026WUZ5_OOCBI|nr:2-hydroxyacylsphingosine 1-beta-galactosyltransferase [Ooceraea biroi]